MPEVNSIQGEVKNTDKKPKLNFAKMISNFSPFSKILKKVNKKILFISIGVVLAIILALVLLSVVLKNFSKENKELLEINEDIIQPRVTLTQSEIQDLINEKLPESSAVEPTSNIDNLILKGNLLYKQGNHKEAYDILKKVANFSQSLANYNIGTMQLDSGNFESSINSYAESINTGQNVSISALNAAVASYNLDRFDLFEYYLKISSDTLQDSIGEPFYSYAYALNNYYKDRYFEMLSPLNNKNAKDFSTLSNRLSAQTYAMFGDNENAIKNFVAANDERDNKVIGLLYARIGDYAGAKGYLGKHISKNRDDIEAILAMQIINLKVMDFRSAALQIDNIASSKKLSELARKTYPIKVIIRPEIFDVAMAQKNFWEKDFYENDKLGYKLLFYFAPYKVFDAKNAIEMIKRSSILKQINIQEGKNVLIRSATTSKIDQMIIDGLVRADTKDLRKALKDMQEASKNNPNHSILFYNLGLLYAQLGHYEEAYKNFLRSYYLDTSDYLIGVMAVLSGRLSHKDTTRLLSDINQNLYNEDFKDEATENFMKNIVNYANDNRLDLEWLGSTKNKEPINYALAYAGASKLKDKQAMLHYLKLLKDIYPNDIIVNVLEVLTLALNENLNEFVFKIHDVLRLKDLDVRALYYGGEFPREIYVFAGFISGFLADQAKFIEDQIIADDKSPAGALQTLARIYLYQQEFEKAHAAYNALMDNLHENDGKTRFLAAVASIGAGDFSEASILLQLTKMDSPAIYEARYALGLLYQAQNNYKAAASAFRFIEDERFMPEFFDFQIDSAKSVGYELEQENLETKITQKMKDK